MPQTEKELRLLSFTQLKKLCKKMNINLGLGGTKGAMIKAVIKADPPTKEDRMRVNAQDMDENQILEQKLKGDGNVSNICTTAQPKADEETDNRYLNNTLSISDAISLVKRLCPLTFIGTTTFSTFRSHFSNYKHLTCAQFEQALKTMDDQLLGEKYILELMDLLELWSNNAWEELLLQLNGNHIFFVDIRPFSSSKNNLWTKEIQLMFTLFKAGSSMNLLQRMRLGVQILNFRSEIWNNLIFMHTFTKAMEDIIEHETHQQIFLSSLIIAKFRNENIVLTGNEKYTNVIQFLEKISLEPTPKEKFQARRWDTLKQNGTLDMNIMIAEGMEIQERFIQAMDFNVIRAKAIKFGSAFEPPMARIQKSTADKQEEIRKEMQNANVNTKLVREQLAQALHHTKVKRKKNKNTNNNNGTNQSLSDDEEEDDTVQQTVDDEEIKDISEYDFSKYEKMCNMGIGENAVRQKMALSGIPPTIADEFWESRNGSLKPLVNNTNSTITANVLPPVPVISSGSRSALMQQLRNNNNNNNNIPNAAPPPIPATFVPLPLATVAQPIPPPLANHSRADRNGGKLKKLVAHNNVGLDWNIVWFKHSNQKNRLRALKESVKALDVRLWEQQQQKQNSDENNNNNNVNESSDDCKNNECSNKNISWDARNDDDYKNDENEFKDVSFVGYWQKLERIAVCMKTFAEQHFLNKKRLSDLDILYHSKFRHRIFSSLTHSKYQALVDGVREGLLIEIPSDILGIIWMFIKPFDELVELKFAVDTISTFFDTRKNRLLVKKLPIQSHRGYENLVF